MTEDEQNALTEAYDRTTQAEHVLLLAVENLLKTFIEDLDELVAPFPKQSASQAIQVANRIKMSAGSQLSFEFPAAKAAYGIGQAILPNIIPTPQ